MTTTGKRSATEQARTARFILAQVLTQIAEYDAHVAKPRMVRRVEVKMGRFDPTIIDRIGQLREQREKWEARIAELLPLEKAERDAAEAAVRETTAERRAERERACNGSPTCSAGAHYHGCYADLDGDTCDEPQAHPVKRGADHGEEG
jgi:hypothetical protein